MKQGRVVRGRQLRTAKEKADLLAAWAASELSTVEFSRQHGVSPSCLKRWRRALEGDSRVTEASSAAKVRFSPVRLESSLPSPLSGGSVLAEVKVSDDVRVQILAGADLERAATLIRALTRSASC